MLTRKNSREIPYVFSEVLPEEAKKQYLTDPENPFWRMYKPEKAAHVLITKNLENKENKENTFSFQQFANTQNPSRFRPLVINMIEEPKTPIKNQDYPFIIDAYTPYGTKMQSKRSMTISTGDYKSTLLFMSPARKDNDLFSKVHIKKRKSVEIEIMQETIEAPAKRLKRKSSGSIIVPAERRDRRLEKHKSNKTVMKKSAEQALLDLLSHIESHKENMSPERLALLKLLAKSFKAEWLHCLAFSLSPGTINPQVAENLGAAPKWINTMMMPLEMLAQHFAAQYPGMVSVEPEFIMLGASDVIDKIKYEVTIQRGQEFVKVSETIDALALPDRSNWPSTTDSIQLKHVLECLMKPSPMDTMEIQDDQNTRSSPRLGGRHGNGAGAI